MAMAMRGSRVAKAGWLESGSIRLLPVMAAFFGSLFLSLIALQKGTINRDGILYVETARVFLEQGIAASMAVYSWPFLSVLMALMSQVTGLGLETSGHLINALFMAGAFALLLACAMRLHPESVWYVCLVVLALPGLNDYRDELLREYGTWFFIMLALWLALRWSEAPRWSMALLVHLSLTLAALFRPEALTLLAAVFLWQVFHAPVGERWRRLAMLGGPPLLGMAMLGALFLSGNLASTRLVEDFGRFNLATFDAKALAIAPAFIDYARDQAHTILFFGSLALVPVKFMTKMGLFIAPLWYAFRRRGALELFGHAQVFTWVFLFHALILAIFALDMQFVSGRYIAPLLLFAAPTTGYGLWLLVKQYPRWKYQMALVVFLIMIANVITFGSDKYHFIEAGEWLAKNAKDTPRVYIESPRTAYYAGWRYRSRPSPGSRRTLSEGLSRNQYDLVVLEMGHNEADIGKWLNSEGLREMVRFENAERAAVIIARPVIHHSVDATPAREPL